MPKHALFSPSPPPSPHLSDDTGNRHLLTGWHFDKCADMALLDSTGAPLYPDARIFALPAGANMPQFQLMVADTTFVQPMHEAARFGVEWVQPSRFGQYFMSVYDKDGTLTGAGEPVIAGAHGGSQFWMLEDMLRVPGGGCVAQTSWHFPMWVCPAEGGMSITSFELEYDAVYQSDQSNWSTRVGSVNHWGYDVERAAPLSGDPGVAGPYDHATVGGWFVHFEAGTPMAFNISHIQAADDTTLMLALPYPPDTTFEVRGVLDRFCNPQNNLLCNVLLHSVGSIQEVRQAPGDAYYFDGTYLYLRLVSMARGIHRLGTTASGWQPLTGSGTCCGDFARAGLSLPDTGSFNYKLYVQAACSESPTDPGRCSSSVTNTPPPACPPGQAQVAINKCEADIDPASFIEERVGELPIILSVPHGGSLKPVAIADRGPGCYNSTADECSFTHYCGTSDAVECSISTSKDSYTLEMSEAMSDALFAATGKRPTLVINKLHRSKVRRLGGGA